MVWCVSSGADLAALVREAAMSALREYMTGSGVMDAAAVIVHATHFDIALSKVKPSVTAKVSVMFDI